MKRICIGLASLLIAACLYIIISQNTKNTLVKKIEFYSDSLHQYAAIYNSSDFSKLKKENENLYNQLREKDALIDALEFKYKYSYKEKENIVSNPIEQDSLYHFNFQTDTVGYDLKIWSTHLQKYKLMFNILNKFTLSKQQVNDQNRIEIRSDLFGQISDVTVWNKKQKKSRFVLGPSIGFGYGITSKKPDIFVGATLTYDLWRR